ncbi:MAG: oligosaccharide flippase family protein [Desulfobacterales bacterium]|nr:oligosaccharide flippase family protein [Desulfobacterales bacterium]MDD4072959.1 oligosaccharide flippase family protein [Desulfobacterales bacterium]MDD4392768.1 oligosaccharide flippase family protein [Desulfobacterales bacterium]
MSEIKIHSLKSQALHLFFGKILAYLIISISPIILVRLISMTQFGVYRQILFVASVALSLIRLRVPGSLYYFFPRKKTDLSCLISQTLTLLLMASIGGSIVFVLLGFGFHLLPSGVSTGYILPIAIYLCVETVAQLIDHIFILDKKPKFVLIVTIADQAVRLVLLLSAALIFDSVMAMVWALIVQSLLRLAVVLIYLSRKYVIRLGLPDMDLLKQQVKYIAPLAAATIVWTVGGKFDAIIISGFMSPEDFAIYSVGALGIMNAVTLLYISLGNVCLPRFGELAMEHDYQGITRIWHKMIIANAVLTVPAAVFCCALAEQFITILFTDRYLAAATIWRINMSALLIQMLGYGYIPTALGKTGAILVSNIVRFALVIPVSIFMISKFGLTGGAISFVIGFSTEAVIQIETTRRTLQLRISKILPWMTIARIIFISGVPLVFLPNLLEPGFRPLLTLMIGALAYFPVVALALIMTGTVDLNEFTPQLRRYRIIDILMNLSPAKRKGTVSGDTSN